MQMMIQKPLLDFFPEEFDPRDNQVSLFERIDECLNSDKKYIIISAPTGTGKSFISKTLANWSRDIDPNFIDLVKSYKVYEMKSGAYTFEDDVNNMEPGGCFALTITKALQDQYEKQFDDTKVLKGRSNYQCEVDPNYDVESAPCRMAGGKIIRAKCWGDNTCTYYNNRNSVLTEKFSALNYSMFFSLPSFLRKRHVLVCDEASELENELVSVFSINLKYKRLDKLQIPYEKLKSDDYTIAIRWLNGLRGTVSSEIESISRQQKLKKKEMSRFKSLVNLSLKLNVIIENWSLCKYVIDCKADEVSYTPLRVSNLSQHIFNYGEKVILMSATIIDPQKFVKTLGIKEDEFHYIECPSVFPSNKSPIYMSSQVSLNYNSMDRNLPIIVNLVRKILDHHKNDKGIIHTHTHKITQYIKNHIRDHRLIFREDGVDNETILKLHNDTDDPTVIVSPSMGFGVSLDNDLARFQIVIKAPYPSLGDKRTKEMFDIDKIWYTNCMLSAFVQQSGRGTRSADDYCATYVLDKTIKDTVIRNRNKLPKEFVDRIH